MSISNASKPELDAKTLTLPLALEKEHPPQLYSFVILGCLTFLALFVAWAFVTNVVEATHAKGEIRPVEKIKTVQHLQGGYVEELLVRVGDNVKAGDLLLRLSPTATESDRDQLEIRLAALKMTLASIDAQAKGLASPDFGDLANLFPGIAADRTSAFVAERDRIQTEQAKLASQLARRQLEFNAAKIEETSVLKRLSIAEQEYDGMKVLVEKGFAPQRDLLAAEANFEEARARLLTLQSKIASAAELEAEARILLDEQYSAIQADLAKQKASGTAELAEANKIMLKYQELVDNLEIVAPVDGTIHTLAFNNAGAVVRPGQEIASIVPNGRNLVAEVRVKPKDIGHIQVGADAKITVSTYDAFTFGHLTGRVQSISPTSFDEAGAAHFKVLVSLDEDVLIYNGMSYPVQAGMEVTADVLTGEKSLAQYLLKPVFRSINQAFSER